jgi:hypothetical protein
MIIIPLLPLTSRLPHARFILEDRYVGGGSGTKAFAQKYKQPGVQWSDIDPASHR